ncbi:MAG: YhbY family RNA-binding protein [Thermoplasmata archaeon]|nr:YhbY family RNA-binding protein [Thermoplasmata archaeon]
MRKKDDDTPILRIGKNGLTPEFVAEAKEQLKRMKVLKVKLPRGLEQEERKALAEELAERTRSILADRRGNTAILRRR